MWEPKLLKTQRNKYVCINGCLPLDKRGIELQGSMLNKAVGIGYSWQHEGDMPVYDWDADFEKYLDKRIELAEELAESGVCLWPWRILEVLPSDLKKSNRLFWSQGGIGSCMSHANTFAYHCATLVEIALGAPLVYSSMNPIVPFYLSKGSLWGGQTPVAMSEYTNKNGQWLESWVGINNQNVPDNYGEYTEKAKSYQTGLCFVDTDDAEEMTERIFRGVHAGLSFAYGQSTAVRGSDTDRNGIKVAELGGSWAHATSVSCYRNVKGTEYLFWANSHGPIYGQSAEGEPADGCWMSRDVFKKFIASASMYGYPYCVFVEGNISPRRQLNRLVNPTFPKGA